MTLNTRRAAPPSGYRVVPLTEVDRDEAIALMRLSLGDRAAVAKTDAYWAWKHEMSVFGCSYVTGARAADDTLASLRIMMRWSFSAPGGSVRLAVRPVDTATHVDHRRRGLFKRLTLSAIDDLRAQGAAFVFNTPNENSLPGNLKMGWSVVAKWPLYGRPVSPLRLMGSFGSNARLESWSDIAVRDAGELEDLVRENELSRTRVGWRTVRSFEYLGWRYGRIPDVEYQVVSVRTDGKLSGAVLGRLATGIATLPVFIVTEIFSRAPSTRSYRMLLRRAARCISAAYLVAHFADGTMERKALRGAGFVRIPRRGYVWTARSLDPSVLPDPISSGAWDLTIGELEIF